MYIPRLAEEAVRRSLSNRKVLIVAGPRQVGKTTLIQYVLDVPGSLSLNFDVEVDKQRFLAASKLPPTDGWRSLGSPKVLVLDEAQRLPETGRLVKGWHDSRVPTKLILLGSSSLNLLDQAAEPLTGRNEKLLLPPLLFQEVLQAQTWYTAQRPRDSFAEQIQSLLLERLAYGSYPEAVTTSNCEAYLMNLTSDYLLKDIFYAAVLKHPDPLKRLVLLLAHQVGSEVSVNELSQSLGLARQTVTRYLDLLEQTFVIFLLPAFSSNPRKEITKRHKVFFWDTGVRNALLKEFSTLPMRSDIGKLFENWVIAEFAKRNLLAGSPANLYFWRTKNGSEVDLIMQRAGRIQAFEIKWAGAKARRQVALAEHYGAKVHLITSRMVELIERYSPLPARDNVASP